MTEKFMTRYRARKVKVVITLVFAFMFIIVGIIGMVSILNILRDSLVSYQDRLILGTTSSISRNVEFYLDKYSASLNSLVQQNRTLEAEKSYLSKGFSDRILRVLQFNIARQGGNMTAMAVFSPEGEFLISSDGKNYELLEDNLDMKAEAVNTYLSKTSSGDKCVVLCSRSKNGLFYTAFLPIQSMFSAATKDKNQDGDLYFLLYDSNEEYIYYSDGREVYISEIADAIKNFKTHGTNMSEINEKLISSPKGYVDEISFQFDNVQWACLIGGVQVKLDFDSLNIFTAMKLDKVVAPVQRGAALLFVSIVLLLAGVFLIIWNIIMLRRRNEQAVQEIIALREKSKMLEELNRNEQELAHRLRLQEIGMMASGIAHEFNNLLTPIMGYSLMILEKLPIEEADNYDSALEIYSASQKAKEIIDQISYLSRKKMDVALKRIAVSDLVEKGIAMAAFAKRGNIEIFKDFDCGEVYVLGNETLLTQIMVNIYINAYQAMSEKSGALSIRTYCGGGKVFIEIGDTGESIEEAIIPRIFEPFFTTKESGKGTGLGLTIVKRIVEEHNGSISASNNDNGGVTFTIAFPVIE